MPFALADVELSQPLPTVTLGAGDEGLGLLVRRRGRPLGFVLRPMAAGSTLDPGALGELIADELREALVRDAVADELRPGVALAPPDVSVVRAAPSDRALRAGGSRWVAFVPPDAALDHGWSAGLAEAIAEHPDAAAVTGLVLPRTLRSQAAVDFERDGGFHLGFEKLRFAGDRRPDVPFYPVDTRSLGAAGNLAVRRDAALAAGGARGGEGALLYRLLRAGHPLVYEPRMLAFHAREAPPRDGVRVLGPALWVARGTPEHRGRAARAAGWWALQSLKRAVGGR